MLCASLAVSNVCLWQRSEPRSAAAEAAPLREEAAPLPELAPYMSRLQTLTHKLGLAVAANDLELTRFYLYESREQVSEILEAVPEYRGQPVALLAERFLDIPYADFTKAVEARAAGELLQQRYLDVIAACNGCHSATLHPFIRISATLPTHNPYLQVFAGEQ